MPAYAQPDPAAAPSVGVLTARKRAVAEVNEATGRVQAQQRVDLVARVTAFIDEQLFKEGEIVSRGQLLYRLERAPFLADVEAKQAAVAQASAQAENAGLVLGRAEELLSRQAGSQSTADTARAAQRSAVAQVRAAEAQLKQSEINLAYTEIKSPIAGRIGRTSLTAGNIVGPSTGILATVVSQDPSYVVFPMSFRRLTDLRDRYAGKGGFDSVALRLRLPNGKIYPFVGKLDFVDISVAQDTDTILLRGVISNPVIERQAGGDGAVRELTNDAIVGVILESLLPTPTMAIPRSAVLVDQQGSYVFVVEAGDVVGQRRIRLGQSTATVAAVLEGLNEGDKIVVDGIQRVRAGIKISPVPVAPEQVGMPADGK